MKLLSENESQNLNYYKYIEKKLKNKIKLKKTNIVLINKIFLIFLISIILIVFMKKRTNIPNSFNLNYQNYDSDNLKENFLNDKSIISSNTNLDINLNENKKINLGKKLSNYSKNEIIYYYSLLKSESKLKFLYEINKRRNFNKRYPLPEEINCFEHIREGGLRDMLAFLSFLTKDTIFFEFGSGCTSVIAKYYAKKSYAVEGNKNWYEEGIKNGLKDNIIFKDIKAISRGKLWSEPGKDSNIEDWKNYFQAYKKEYNADVIFIDGRFRTACAFDIFNKIRNDTLILIHEYFRKSYLAIAEYYDYIYHWDTMFLFKKKNNINQYKIKTKIAI